MALKITVIGMSNAGKTCYLAATYGQMMRGISGFKYSAIHYDQSTKLRRMWKSLTSKDNPAWPSGTQNATETFSFSCRYNEKPLIPGTESNSSENMFQWIDYRGGLWEEEQGGDDKTTEIGKLYEQSVGADALVVAIPGDVLVKCVENPNDEDVFNMFDQYWFVLDRLCQKNLESFHQTPIVFMITKSDQIDPRTEMPVCLRKVKDAFPFCFETTQRACMITAVSLGNFKDMTQGGKMNGEFKPSNLHLPVLLPFYLWIRDQDRKTRALFESAKSDADWYRRWESEELNKSLLKKLFTGNDAGYYKTKARDAEALYKQYQEKYKDLVTAADNIKYELEDSSVLYEYGKRTIKIEGLDI